MPHLKNYCQVSLVNNVLLSGIAALVLSELRMDSPGSSWFLPVWLCLSRLLPLLATPPLSRASFPSCSGSLLTGALVHALLVQSTFLLLNIVELKEAGSEAYTSYNKSFLRRVCIRTLPEDECSCLFWGKSRCVWIKVRTEHLEDWRGAH